MVAGAYGSVRPTASLGFTLRRDGFALLDLSGRIGQSTHRESRSCRGPIPARAGSRIYGERAV